MPRCQKLSSLLKAAKQTHCSVGTNPPVCILPCLTQTPPHRHTTLFTMFLKERLMHWDCCQSRDPGDTHPPNKPLDSVADLLPSGVGLQGTHSRFSIYHAFQNMLRQATWRPPSKVMNGN